MDSFICNSFAGAFTYRPSSIRQIHSEGLTHILNGMELFPVIPGDHTELTVSLERDLALGSICTSGLLAAIQSSFPFLMHQYTQAPEGPKYRLCTTSEEVSEDH